MWSFFGAEKVKQAAAQSERRLRVEGLERREMMASNFTANLVRGQLAILGSADNDSLSITQINGNLLVAASGSINGGSNVRTFSGVSSLYITLAGGIDSVNVGAVHMPENLAIYTDFEAGAGIIVPGNTAAQDRTDTVSITNARIDGFLGVFMGGGNDSLSMSQVVTGAVFGDANIYTGAGDDNVSLSGVSVKVGNTVIDAGRGNDVVTVGSSAFAGRFYAALGDGNDQIVVANSRFGLVTTIDGGPGLNRKTILRNSFAVTPIYLTI